MPTLKVAASCEVVLFIVPAIKGAPEAVHWMLSIAIVSEPDTRLPFAGTLSVGVPDERTFAVTATVVFAGIDGVLVGLASGKLIFAKR